MGSIGLKPSKTVGSPPTDAVITHLLLAAENPRLEKRVRVWLAGADDGKYTVEHGPSLGRTLQLLARGMTDIVVLDLNLPDSHGLDTLLKVRKAAPLVSTLVLLEAEDHGLGLEAVQGGAHDYLGKEKLDQAALLRSIRLALERRRLEREQFHRMFESAQRLVSPEVLQRMAVSKDLSIHTDQLLITVLFADVRGFTSLAEQLPKQFVLELLNHLLEEMATPIHEEGGYLDKFLGDGLMAIFGAPKPTDNDWLHAVRAAAKMQDRIEEFNRRRHQFLPELATLAADREVRIGVGVHSGLATVGFIGTSNHCEYTAIGDCVNIASRLCAMAQAGEVLITRVVADGLVGFGEVGDWRQVQLKGKAVTTEVASVRAVKF